MTMRSTAPQYCPIVMGYTAPHHLAGSGGTAFRHLHHSHIGMSGKASHHFYHPLITMGGTPPHHPHHYPITTGSTSHHPVSRHSPHTLQLPVFHRHGMQSTILMSPRKAYFLTIPIILPSAYFPTIPAILSLLREVQSSILSMILPLPWEAQPVTLSSFPSPQETQLLTIPIILLSPWEAQLPTIPIILLSPWEAQLPTIPIILLSPWEAQLPTIPIILPSP